MNPSRVEVIGASEFNPREWLRRGVLWASIVAPYGRQLDTWIYGTAYAQHAGNVSRQHLFVSENDLEIQSLAFFNQGKNISGLISSAVLFRSLASGTYQADPENLLAVQARYIDKALGNLSIRFGSVENEEIAFYDCTRLVKSALFGSPDRFGRKHKLVRASKIMLVLANREINSWLENSQQNWENSLPTLTIQNGGHPRSGGSRVGELQTVFDGIVSSQTFNNLAQV